MIKRKNNPTCKSRFSVSNHVLSKPEPAAKGRQREIPDRIKEGRKSRRVKVKDRERIPKNREEGIQR
jgi:hypothetical protein